MKKHAICYTILVLTIVVMAGQITSPKNNDVALNEPKTIIVEPDDYKQNKRDLKNAKIELEKKEKLITKLNSVINDKTSEVEKIKLAKLEDLKPAADKKKNPLMNLLSSAGKMANSPQVKKMMKKRLLKKYASLFNKLNLDEDKKEELVQLLLDRDQQKQEKLMSLLSSNSSGDKINPEDFKDLGQKTDADQEIQELLGSDYEDFDYYEKTAFERRQLNDINTSLATEDKLSGQQEDQVVGLLKKRNDDIKAGNKKSDEEYVAESSEFLNQNQSDELGKSLKRNKNNFGSLPFINGGSSNVQVIHTIE